MEAKVTGAYAFDPEIVMGYHDALVKERGIGKNDHNKQINRMLRPYDYFLLDNLGELVFPQTDAEIPDVPEDTLPDRVENDTPPGKKEYKVVEKLPKDEELLHYTGKKVEATGYYLADSDTFIVLKGVRIL